MAETFLVRFFDEQGDDCEWLALTVAAQPMHGSAADMADAVKACDAILLLPATQVLLLELELPIAHPRELKKALPFALEEYLAQDVEAYHWVWRKLADGKIAVAAVAHECLTGWLQRFDELGVKLRAVYAETLWLPMDGDTVSIALDRGRAIVRYANGGGGVDADGLQPLLDPLLTEPPPRLRVWRTPAGDELRWPENCQENYQIETETVASLLPVLRATANPALDLLTDPYRPCETDGIPWQAWLPAAALVLLAVLVQYGNALNRYGHSQRQLAAQESANRQLFNQAFPDIKRIVNINAQAQQGLAELRKLHGAGGGVFLPLLHAAGVALAQDSGLQPQTLDFANNALNLHLTGGSIAQLEQFKQRLEQNPELQMRIQSAETGSDGWSAHVEITRRPS